MPGPAVETAGAAGATGAAATAAAGVENEAVVGATAGAAGVENEAVAGTVGAAGVRGTEAGPPTRGGQYVLPGPEVERGEAAGAGTGEAGGVNETS